MLGCLAQKRAPRARNGTSAARPTGMPVRDFQDLVCWQLSYELRREVFAFTATGPAARDFKYRDQIRDSSASAPRNIAEGFGRFRAGEFARYLEYAKASLDETHHHLIDGRDSGYLSQQLYDRLANLLRAARKTTVNLLLVKQRQAQDARKAPRKAP